MTEGPDEGSRGVPDGGSPRGSDMARGMSQASFGLSVALAFAGIVVGAWLIGREIDDWLGIEPWAQIVGAVGGWVLGTIVVYYAAQRRSE